MAQSPFDGVHAAVDFRNAPYLKHCVSPKKIDAPPAMLKVGRSGSQEHHLTDQSNSHPKGIYAQGYPLPHEKSGLAVAGLDDTEVIDLVAEQADGSALLVIVKEGNWDPQPDILALKAKLNTYAQFALDGGLIRLYPSLAGREIAIVVESSATPPRAITEVLVVAGEKLRPYRVSVTSTVNPRL